MAANMLYSTLSADQKQLFQFGVEPQDLNLTDATFPEKMKSQRKISAEVQKNVDQMLKSDKSVRLSSFAVSETRSTAAQFHLVIRMVEYFHIVGEAVKRVGSVDGQITLGQLTNIFRFFVKDQCTSEWDQFKGEVEGARDLSDLISKALFVVGFNGADETMWLRLFGNFKRVVTRQDGTTYSMTHWEYFSRFRLLWDCYRRQIKSEASAKPMHLEEIFFYNAQVPGLYWHAMALKLAAQRTFRTFKEIQELYLAFIQLPYQS